MLKSILAIIVCGSILAVPATSGADDAKAAGAAGAQAPKMPKRLLLLGQGSDGHPPTTHEYHAGLYVIAQCLQNVDGLQTVPVRADEPWKEGPELLESADGVVLFLSEGAKWLSHDPQRLAAFQKFAKRGGGVAVLHWGMGTKDAKNIDAFVALAGGCHGGPDRKYKVVDVRTEVADVEHPILRGVEPVDVHEEFYYALKLARPAGTLTPLLRAPINGAPQTVSWAWERPDGGRSFGFSGLHFHKNWEHAAYRRLVAQGVLWTLDLPVPAQGLAVDISPRDLQRPPGTK